ncbi:MAG TPA: MBL fold metallo-hydrolase [Thermomicrobiales bacterium]|nr:MBL fold metallo-hydrolase [Thermomicrobiales bacterium]
MSDTQHLTITAGDAPADLATGSIFFIGNATVLLRYAGFTILTDPTFIHMHEQTWLGYGMHTTRLVNPAIDIDQLPPLDLIVLSHFHGDHFDQVVERDLDKRLPIVTCPDAAQELTDRGFGNTFALETWKSLTVTKGGASLQITATPARHGPAVVDLAMPEVMGSILEFRSGNEPARYRMYITGDTLVYDDIKEIPRRYPDIDLALLHLGGTEVLGIMVTMDGKQGVEMLRIVDPTDAIPIHYNDYDVFKSPLSDFEDEVNSAGLAQRVHYLRHGDTFTFEGHDPRIDTPLNQGDTSMLSGEGHR